MGHSGYGVKPPFTDIFAVKDCVVLGFVVQGTHSLDDLDRIDEDLGRAGLPVKDAAIGGDR